MSMTAFSRPPGLYDRLPDETADANDISARLQGVMNRFGYQRIETPILEFADLFLAKSGDESVNRLFHFELRGRHLCLRSEFTPSAVRLYVERFQHEPKPLRWQFAGPVFRYESPQRSHSRQFTMLGAELIGPTGTSGDAETLGMAAQGLYAIGLRDWTMTVGHVGLVSQLLDRFGLDRRVKRALLGQIENLRRPERGRKYVEEQVGQLYAGAAPAAPTSDKTSLDDDATKMSRTISLLLESANMVMPNSTRTPEEIARRLLNKQQRAQHHADTLRAIEFLDRLTQIEETPTVAFAELGSLVATVVPDEAALNTLRTFRATVGLLEAYGVPQSHTRLMMGMARGLNYYTGIVFEVHTLAGDSASQLCGGGRYDDFIRISGASADTPAVGMSYGLERLLQERTRQGLSSTPYPPSHAVVIPIEEADNVLAAQVAMRLRDIGRVELYPPPVRNLSQVLTRLGKSGVPLVFIVGEMERVANKVSMRDMRAGSQTTCTVDEAMTALKGRMTE
jgi:histidyl-tRNA synthetase